MAMGWLIHWIIGSAPISTMMGRLFCDVAPPPALRIESVITVRVLTYDYLLLLTNFKAYRQQFSQTIGMWFLILREIQCLPMKWSKKDNHQAASNKTLNAHCLWESCRPLAAILIYPMPVAADHRCPMNYCNSIVVYFAAVTCMC